MYNTRIPTIKHWAMEDRPREKLLNTKAINLSNAELIAILIGSGSIDESAVSLAHRMLHSVDDDLNRFCELSIQDLSRFKGIGFAKAISIVAAIELCHKRMGSTKLTRQYQEGDSSGNNDMIREELFHETGESYWVFLFSGSGMLIHKQCIGDQHTKFGDPRNILQIALEHESTSFMLVHYTSTKYSHPTEQDLSYTLKLVKSANMLSIIILDHIITYPEGHYSFRDHDLLIV